MKFSRKKLRHMFSFSWRDLWVAAAIFLCATGACVLLHQLADTTDGFASPVYVLAVLLISRFTDGYLFGLIAAVLGVIGVNYVFTYPYMAFNFTIAGYPLTILTFLVVSLVTSALTSQAKEQDRLRMENEKVKMRADLLRSVSHDIRTPLTSIVGATSTVLDNPALSKEEQTALLTDVRDDAQWLIRVVENLLSITRIGNDQAKITKQPEAAEEVLGEAVQKFRKRFPAVAVEARIPEELLLIPIRSNGRTTGPALPCGTTARASRPRSWVSCLPERSGTTRHLLVTESAIWASACRCVWRSSVPTAAPWKPAMQIPARNSPSACRSQRRNKRYDDPRKDPGDRG